MEEKHLKSLVEYRAIIGYLGEREQFSWWPSSFFSTGSQAFLSPIFSKTQLLAQCNGITQAATIVHDERIGTGHVYHLFRLPEDMEQDIHKMLHNPTLSQELMTLITDKETALAFLAQHSATVANPSIGPFRVGTIADLRNVTSWHNVAAHYTYAFTQGIEIFPYFANIS